MKKINRSKRSASLLGSLFNHDKRVPTGAAIRAAFGGNREDVPFLCQAEPHLATFEKHLHERLNYYQEHDENIRSSLKRCVSMGLKSMIDEMHKKAYETALERDVLREKLAAAEARIEALTAKKRKSC